MIDVKTEKFTAAEAVKAGLIQSVRSGAVRIEGNYTLTPKVDGVRRNAKV